MLSLVSSFSSLSPSISFLLLLIDLTSNLHSQLDVVPPYTTDIAMFSFTGLIISRLETVYLDIQSTSNL